jgi:hypothetical protein
VGLRKAIGVVLRLPLIMVLTLLWIVYVWSFIFAYTILCVTIKPLFFPVAWLWWAFIGSNAKASDYFQGYPGKELKILTSGFPTLKKWLTVGFSS